MRALGGAARNLIVNRLIVACIARNNFVREPCPLRISHRIDKTDPIKTMLQSPQVLAQSKRISRIHRHHFVDAITEDETAIEHGNACFAKRHEVAIEIYDFASHGHLT